MRDLLSVLKTKNRPYLMETELKSIFDGSAHSRYGKVKRMLAQGRLLHIRRGLYCLADNSVNKPHSFELAQYIYGPSYVSLESALSYHNLIPEVVYTTTSVSGKRSKEFTTPLGIFSYQKVPLDGLYTHVQLIKEKDFSFFIAKPWKAICDYVYCYRKNWRGLEPFEKSLRIDLDNLPYLSNEESLLLESYYHHNRITKFLRSVTNYEY